MGCADIGPHQLKGKLFWSVEKEVESSKDRVESSSSLLSFFFLSLLFFFPKEKQLSRLFRKSSEMRKLGELGGTEDICKKRGTVGSETSALCPQDL